MGYTVLATAFKPRTSESSSENETGERSEPTDNAQLSGALEAKINLILGPSGAGKSTLINRWIPDAQVLTQEISSALNSGKHTTTSTTLYWMDAGKTTALIDSPGFQEFGLNHIGPMQLAQLMPDIAAHATDCKFYNCSHLHEPGCGVISTVQATTGPAEISASRYKIYSDLFAELSQTRY
jgi:ribosome biogenesis GTPase